MADLAWLLNPTILLFLARGLGITVSLALVAEIVALAFGAVLALGRLSRHPAAHVPAVLYIETLRSIPLLLIVFFVFFALNPMLHLGMSPFFAGVVALGSFNAAVLAEIIRAGIQSVPRGVIQAAESQALARWQIFVIIQMPLAVRRMMPALVTQFISLTKSTSLLVVIGVQELLSRAAIVTQMPPYRAIPVYVLVALAYFVVDFALSLMSKHYEKLEAGGMRRA